MATSSPRKVAIVTGAAQGIGEAIAYRLARDGFDVVISDIPEKAQQMDAVVPEVLKNGGAGARAMGIVCDVKEETQVQNLVDQTVEKFGRLDCMVANAGIAILNPLASITVEEFTEVHAVNTRGIMLCYRTAALAMIKGGTARGGRIIGACSIAGKMGGALHGSYSSSKFAIRGLTQIAAHEFGEQGINVNAYAPGLVDTPLLKSGSQSMAAILGVPESFYVTSANARTALKRVGKPEEIASLVSFLASDQSSFITGQIISVDGGFNMGG